MTQSSSHKSGPDDYAYGTVDRDLHFRKKPFLRRIVARLLRRSLYELR